VKTLLLAGVAALGLATGASAQGLSFSGGEFSAFGNSFTGTPGNLQVYSAAGAMAFDLTGTPWEVQADVLRSTNPVTSSITQGRITAGYQTGGNAKFGIYGGGISVPASPTLTTYGAVAMIGTGGDNYLDLDFGRLGIGGGPDLSYGGVRYSMGGFFAQALFLSSPVPISFYNASIGYEYTFANNISLSAMVGSTTASVLPSSITTGKVVISIPFGGANSGGSDARLFWNANIFDVFPVL